MAEPSSLALCPGASLAFTSLSRRAAYEFLRTRERALGGVEKALASEIVRGLLEGAK